jgi:1-acyl-sn-glycerol-3-phosphate acyltransferase
MADPKVVPPRGGSETTRRPGASGADALATGAARASGERAKRRQTPLLRDSAADEIAARPALTSVDGNGAIRAHRPRPTPKPRPVPTARAARGASAVRATSASETRPHGQSGRPKRAASAASATTSSPITAFPSERFTAETATPSASLPDTASAALSDDAAAPARAGSGLDDLVRIAIATLRAAATASGLPAEDVERQVAGTLAFVRRRLTGDYTVDDFGFDEDFTENIYLPLLRPLYKSWFRVEVRGIENIPSAGGALVVSNHSGTIALDSLMAQVAVHDQHPARRHLRMLGADLVFRTPIIGEVARKSGSTLAANPDAERLLASGELAGVWPEGFKGVGKPFSERYKLQRFGRGGFVAAALRTGAPIVPCSIVGAEEIYPIIGNLKTVARLIGAPYIPVTPTFPLLGLLGLIPLPSKWIIEFGAPVETVGLGPQAADDPMVVFDLTDQVRETIQQTLYALLMQRRSVFF